MSTRVLEAEGDPGLCQILREASQGLTGEAVVRSRDQIGRVLFHEGKVAWVHVPGTNGTMTWLTGMGVPAPEVRRVLEECREKHLPFLDTLVSRGMVAREALQEGFRRELASRLRVLLSMPLATALLAHGALTFESTFAFDLAELEPMASSPPEPSSSRSLPDARQRLAIVPSARQRAEGSREEEPVSARSAPPSRRALPDRSPPRPESPPADAAWSCEAFRATVLEGLGQLRSLGGFLGAALVDSDTGAALAVLGGHGESDTEEEATSHAELLRVQRRTVKALNDEIEDIVIALGAQYHLLRTLRERPGLFFYLALDRGGANLAMARMTLADLDGSLHVQGRASAA